MNKMEDRMAHVVKAGASGAGDLSDNEVYEYTAWAHAELSRLRDFEAAVRGAMGDREESIEALTVFASDDDDAKIDLDALVEIRAALTRLDDGRKG